MIPSEPIRRAAGFSALRQFVKTASDTSKRQRGEHCEMCAMLLPEVHPHLVEPATRRIVCACDACALLFDNPAQMKYRRVPRRIRRLVDFQLSDAQWNDLLIPINMAFFFHSTPAERVVAIYPSPAGPVESLLTLESWTGMVADNPLLATMEADVEALLVNRLAPQSGFSEPEYFLAPIDECYKLVGVLRMQWRGLSGGAEVWGHIQRFFADLGQRATPVRGRGMEKIDHA
ncbi:MAG TPA: DUF5947 family protein [Pirellulales bacterium]|jgi:hypothetical protein|nr:DUF5947 family protein [Pirellulales bacterium]